MLRRKGPLKPTGLRYIRNKAKVLNRTYLENRILKIQNNEKTSEVKLFIE